MERRPDIIPAVIHPDKVGCRPDRMAAVRHPDKVERWPGRIPDVRHPSGMSDNFHLGGMSCATRRKGEGVMWHFFREDPTGRGVGVSTLFNPN